MGVWSKARPLVVAQAKDGGLVADSFPEFVAFTDEFLAGMDPARVERDGDDLLLRFDNGTATYAPVSRDAAALLTLAQLKGVAR